MELRCGLIKGKSSTCRCLIMVGSLQRQCPLSLADWVSDKLLGSGDIISLGENLH